MLEVERQEEPAVQDLASAWGNRLKQEAEERPEAVSVAGSRRAATQSAAQSQSSASLRGKDLEPFVRALGNFACRVAKVSPMSAAEASAISEPGASVLNKWAPTVAEWVPELTLITELSNFVESRADEFKKNRESSEGDAPAPEPIIADKF